MYQEKITMEMCDNHEKAYFIQKAEHQIQLYELNKKQKTGQNSEIETLTNIKDIMSEIQDIQKLKQVEIQHFENKIFSIDR